MSLHASLSSPIPEETARIAHAAPGFDASVLSEFRTRLGRVPQTCGYCFETSAVPPASYGSAGHEPSKPVRNPSSAPVDLQLSTRSLSTPRSSTSYG